MKGLNLFFGVTIAGVSLLVFGCELPSSNQTSKATTTTASDLDVSALGDVVGTVFDENGTPLMGASVTYYQPTARGSYLTTTTDDHGRYIVSGLVPGQYSFEFRKEAASANGPIPLFQGRIINVTVPSVPIDSTTLKSYTVVTQDATLPSLTASMTGTLYQSSTGSTSLLQAIPLASKTVWIDYLSLQYNSYGTSSIVPTPETRYSKATTDALGRFTFTQLPAAQLPLVQVLIGDAGTTSTKPADATSTLSVVSASPGSLLSMNLKGVGAANPYQAGNLFVSTLLSPYLVSWTTNGFAPRASDGSIVPLTVTFSKAMSPLSGSIVLVGSNGNNYSPIVSWSNDQKTLTLTPGEAFRLGDFLTLSLKNLTAGDGSVLRSSGANWGSSESLVTLTFQVQNPDLFGVPVLSLTPNFKPNGSGFLSLQVTDIPSASYSVVWKKASDTEWQYSGTLSVSSRANGWALGTTSTSGVSGDAIQVKVRAVVLDSSSPWSNILTVNDQVGPTGLLIGASYLSSTPSRGSGSLDLAVQKAVSPLQDGVYTFLIGLPSVNNSGYQNEKMSLPTVTPVLSGAAFSVDSVVLDANNASATVTIRYAKQASPSPNTDVKGQAVALNVKDAAGNAYDADPSTEAVDPFLLTFTAPSYSSSYY